MKTFKNQVLSIFEFKKIAIGMLFAILLLACVRNEAKAESNDFIIEDGVLIKYLGDSSNVTVPDGVTAIGDFSFGQNTDIAIVVMSDSVETVGSYAFSGCSKLRSVVFPDSLKSIKNGAFSQCKSLSSITFPESLTELGEFAFSSSANLKYIKFPSSSFEIGWSAFLGTQWLKDRQKESPFVIVNNTLIDATTSVGNVTIPDTVTIIGNYAFFYNSKVTQITIPSSVTVIQQSAFSACPNLKKVIIPNSVETLGESAFAACTGLTSVQLSNSLTSIAPNLFSSCSSLTSIIIPAQVKSIGISAFNGCSKLEKVDFPSFITSIGSSAFAQCRSLTSIELPNRVTTIGNYAFEGCERLSELNLPTSIVDIGARAFAETPWLAARRNENKFVVINDILVDAGKTSGKVTIPDGVTKISPYAFFGSSITEAILPAGVTEIGESAFSVSSLKAVTLPDGFTKIGNSAFRNANITSIQIPNSVVTIDAFAFYRCSNLKSVVVPEGVITIGKSAFAWCDNLTQITLPKSVKQIANNFIERDNKLETINISPDNPNYIAKNNFLLSKDGTILYSYPKTTGEVVIPNGVQIISQGLFHNTYVTKITFPSTLKTLEDDVFYNCSELTEILLPSSLVTFGSQKFEFCRNLKAINTFEANKTKNYISENGILYNEDKTTLVCNPASGKIVVPDFVTAIGDYAFPNVNISITIPNSVTTIGYNIFVNEDDEWTPANEEPLHVYGYVGSAIEAYCLSKNWGVRFLAFDADYSIAYNLNGGKNNKSNPATYNYNSKEIILKNPTRAGYVFLYWYIDISICEDGDCRGEKQVTSIPAKSLGNFDLIAKWEKVNVTKAVINSAKTSGTKINLVLSPIKKVDGYEIVYAINNTFTSGKKIKTASSTKVTLDKLVKGRTYYVKVRGYRIDSTGKKIYGSYSTVKKVKL